jgi:hypothetical protein
MSTIPSQAPFVPAVDPDLRRIIRRVESNENYGALRFERLTFNKITAQGSSPIVIAIQRIHQCSSDTARVIYSMSFGAYQLMGFNLYARHKDGSFYDKPVTQYLESVVDQDNQFGKFLDDDDINVTWASLKAYRVTLDHFAVRYNGSTAYSDRMIQAAKELGL